MRRDIIHHKYSEVMSYIISIPMYVYIAIILLSMSKRQYETYIKYDVIL